MPLEKYVHMMHSCIIIFYMNLHIHINNQFNKTCRDYILVTIHRKHQGGGALTYMSSSGMCRGGPPCFT